MNKYQLNYIKEQQQKNVIIIPSIKKRDKIDSSIINELEVIYNPNLLGMETVFKSSLADITMPADFLEDSIMIKMIREYGSDVMMIYMYLHSKMSQEGYRIKWDEIQIDVLTASVFGIYKIPIEKFKTIITALVKSKLLYVITDTQNEKWLTSVYQVFAYERVAAKRLRDRLAKRNASLKKSEKIKTKCAIPSFEEEMKAEEEIQAQEQIEDGFMDNINPEDFFGTPQQQQIKQEEDTTSYTDDVKDTELEYENICF